MILFMEKSYICFFTCTYTNVYAARSIKDVYLSAGHAYSWGTGGLPTWEKDVEGKLSSSAYICIL